MTKQEKIKVITEYLTNDENQIKKLEKEIADNWFDFSIDCAAFNLLDNEVI